MIFRHRSLGLGARKALVCGLAVFTALQLGLAIRMDRRQPDLRDPEYGYKLLLLRERLATEPNRPLMLLVGSSRVALGLSPETLATCLPAGQDSPIIFNFAMNGSGPLLERMLLRRLLAAGIHPRWLILEVLPPLLHQEAPWCEPEWLTERPPQTLVFHFWRI